LGAVYFDTKITPGDVVEVVNDYSVFSAPDGGWADANYRAIVKVRINENVYTSGIATLDLGAIGEMPLPDFDPRNSNVTKAQEALENLIPYLNGFVDRADQETAFGVKLIVTNEAVSELYRRIEGFKSTLYPELQAQVIVPPMTLKFTRTHPSLDADDKLDVSVQCNVVDGKFAISPPLDKYASVEIDVYGVPVTDTGSLTHLELEDEVELVNSGLPANLSRVQQANVLKLGIYAEREYPGEQSEDGSPFQANFFTPCSEDGWYDRLNSSVDYSLRFETSPSGLDLPYAVTVAEVGGNIWVGGLGGILSIDPDDHYVSKVAFPTSNRVSALSIYVAGSTTYILTTDGLFKYDGTVLTKDVDLDIPNGTSSLIFLRGSYIVASTDGLFYRRTFDLAWKKLLDIRDVKMVTTGTYVVVYGKDPRRISDSVAYTSVDGLSWSSATLLEDLEVTGVARIGSQIYFATTTGLHVQDLSKADGSSPQINLVDLLEDEDESRALVFNDVAADTERVVAAASDGTYYVYDSGDFTASDSGLGALHKAQIIDGSIWLFGRQYAKIEDEETAVRLSTGEALL
jgi:hypothetical protein